MDLTCCWTAILFPALLASEPCPAGIEAVRQGDVEKAAVLLQQCTEAAGAPLEAFLALAGIYQTRRDGDALLGWRCRESIDTRRKSAST
ncbi:MAG: hypothetical protein WKF37_01050 [Bryobacteraceae bacterium]